MENTRLRRDATADVTDVTCSENYKLQTMDYKNTSSALLLQDLWTRRKSDSGRTEAPFLDSYPEALLR